mmetsp:Transcript_24088/g.29479  ORF Transcript_24088/g.29479 Transcript_24088/m.29479 type:complete len:178 (+) Transcript_24088:25-558(+)
MILVRFQQSYMALILFTKKKVYLRLLDISGEFCLPKVITSESRFVFVSAGSGITPVVSMLRHLCRNEYIRHDGIPVAKLIYSVRSVRDIIFEKELSDLSKTGTVNVIIYLSRENELPAHCPKGFAFSLGRITKNVINKEIGDPNQYESIFSCGPGGFTSVVESALPNSKVITESFNF